jgi:hypothetical protein
MAFYKFYLTIVMLVVKAPQTDQSWGMRPLHKPLLVKNAKTSMDNRILAKFTKTENRPINRIIACVEVYSTDGITNVYRDEYRGTHWSTGYRNKRVDTGGTG